MQAITDPLLAHAGSNHTTIIDHEPAPRLQTRATRRTFLGATAGAASAAPRSARLLASRRRSQATSSAPASARRPAAASPALHPQSQTRPLPVPIRRLLARRPLRQQTRRSHKYHGKELPPSVKGNQRLTGMTSGQAQLPGRRPDVARPPLRPARHLDQRPPAAHANDRRRHLHRQIDVHRGDQPRPGHHVHQHRQPAARLRQHGRVDQLRPRQHERKPADVHRDDLARHRQEPGPADLLAALGQRLPAVDAPRRRPPRRREPGALSRTTRPASTATSAARCSTTSPSSTTCAPTKPAIPKRSPASTPTKWRSACRPRCPS